MGAAVGASSVPHETRRALRWHRSIRPLDGEDGIWRDGVLEVGKYQQFAADEPRSVHHPEQHAKWAPHELLHRACGYFFRADASRFELYLGARLNEALPVATWYGLEQCLRLDETGAFDRRRTDRHEAVVADAFWLTADREALLERATAMAPLFRQGLAHARGELDVCRADLAHGRVSKTEHAEAFLDASSDALGYVAMHAERLRAPAVARLHGLLAREHDRRIAAYADRVERALDELLFADITVDAGAFRRRAARRRGWDRALRHAVRVPDASGASLRALLEERDEGDAAVRLDGELPDVRQLDAGIRKTLPASASRRSLARSLAASPHLLARAPLGERVARMLSAAGDEAGADLARLESALAVKRPADDRMEVLEDLGAATERRVSAVVNRSASVLAFATDPLALLQGEPSRPGPTACVVASFRGQRVLAPIDPRHAEPLSAGAPELLPETVQRTLADAGILLRLSRA